MYQSNFDYMDLKGTTGDTTDISEWLEFEFYDLYWYWDVPND